MLRHTHLAAVILCGTVAFGQAGSTTQTPTSQTPQATSTDTTNTTTKDKTTKTKAKMSDTASASGSESMVGAADRAFIMKAAEGGMMEVQLAQLAQKQAASDQVKQYAQKLEQDHSTANKQLTDIAQRRGVDVPSTLKPENQQMIDKLSKLSGAEFDKEYVEHMVKDHKKDVKEFDKESQKAMDTDVKTFAANTLPTLKDHLAQAETLDKTMGSSGTRSRTKDTSSDKTKTMDHSSDKSMDRNSDKTLKENPQTQTGAPATPPATTPPPKF